MRYLVDLFGYSTLIWYLCRRICDVIDGILSHKVECIMYIHERDNWTDFRWNASEVSLFQEKVLSLQVIEKIKLTDKSEFV